LFNSKKKGGDFHTGSLGFIRSVPHGTKTLQQSIIISSLLTCWQAWQSLPRSYVGKRSWFHILRNSHTSQQVALPYTLPEVHATSNQHAIETFVGNVLVTKQPKTLAEPTGFVVCCTKSAGFFQPKNPPL